MVRNCIAIIAGFATVFLGIRYSMYGGLATFMLTDSLFPAVSAVTNNTSTTGGLTPSIHNLSFLVFALFAGIFTAIAVQRGPGNCRLWVATVTMVSLCFVSSANFWANERLITLAGQALMAVSVLLPRVTWAAPAPWSAHHRPAQLQTRSYGSRQRLPAGRRRRPVGGSCRSSRSERRWRMGDHQALS